MHVKFPYARWATVYVAHDTATQADIDDLGELVAQPGARLLDLPEGVQLEVPQTLWSAAAFERLIERAEARVPVERTFVPWHPAEPLYPHQRIAVAFLLANGGGLCADDMGLGKTRTAIAAGESMGRFYGPTRPRVIVGPRYVRETWRRELLALGAIERPEQLSCAEGRDPGQKFDYANPWWFVHYDIAQGWQGMLSIGPRRPSVVILDELHWCKNGLAKRSKAAAAIAHAAPHRIGLTGTPLPNRPSELWWPLTMLDGPHSWGSPGDFRRRYCGAYHDGYGLVDGLPSNVDELQRRIATSYIRRTLDDAEVELPSLTRRRFDVVLDEVDQRRHDEVVAAFGGGSKLLEAIFHGGGGKNTIAHLTRLRKITSAAKLPSTTALVEDYAAQGESVVVFTWERATAEKLASRVKDARTYVVHGGVEQDERDSLVAQFQAEGGVLLATLGALREGVTLHKARHLILHDLDWVPANVLQAERRVYRIGQTRPTFVTWMLASGSVDVLLAEAIAVKSAAASTTLGIESGTEVVEDLDLERFVSAVSVEDDVMRLLARWDSLDAA